MNELIKITEKDGAQLINARDLHKSLRVGRDFSTWIKNKIEKYKFFEGEDFFTREILSSPNLGSSKSRPQKMLEYFLTIGTAKELAMVENNEAGREIRRYLIRVEKKFRELAFSGENLSLTEVNSRLERMENALLGLAAGLADIKKGQNAQSEYAALPLPEDTHADILRFGGKFLEITGKDADFVEANVLFKLFFRHAMTVPINSKKFFEELSYIFPQLRLDSSRKYNPIFRGCVIK